MHAQACRPVSMHVCSAEAGEYLKFFVFTGMTLDQALRWVVSLWRVAPTLWTWCASSEPLCLS